MSREQAVVDQQVASMFRQSQAFRALPPDEQATILQNTSSLVSSMAEDRLARGMGSDPTASAQLTAADLTGGGNTSDSGGGGVDPSTFTGGATDNPAFGPTKEGDFGTGVATGVGQAGELLRQVNFPAFVGELIQGVFQAIVDASIQQMKAYGELVQSVTMSLNDFRDQNVTENQGRDHLVGKFPNLMQINMGSEGPRVGLRQDADLDSMPDFSDLGEPGLTDLDDEIIEERLVPAARNDLARQRQQLLATMVMMGINRIVVTDGKINAKLKFNFSASDRMTRHATDYDYKNYGMTTTFQKEGDSYERDASEYERETAADGSSTTNSSGGASRWTRGDFQYAQAPTVYVTGIEETQTEAALAASAQLAGNVTVNFKTESLDLNQFASQSDLVNIRRTRGAGRGASPAADQPTTS